MRCSRPTRLTARRKSTRRWRSPWPIPATCSNSSLPFRSKSGQPNLFLAAVRHVCGIPRDAEDLRQSVRIFGVQIREVMLSHTTQTNEPARCAVCFRYWRSFRSRWPCSRWGPLPGFVCFQIIMAMTTATRELLQRYWATILRRYSSATLPPRSRYRKRSLASRGALDWTSILSTCDRSMIPHGLRPSSGPGRMRGQRSCVPPSTLRGAIRQRWSGVICGRTSHGWRQRHRETQRSSSFKPRCLVMFAPVGTRAIAATVREDGAE